MNIAIASLKAQIQLNKLELDDLLKTFSATANAIEANLAQDNALATELNALFLANSSINLTNAINRVNAMIEHPELVRPADVVNENNAAANFKDSYNDEDYTDHDNEEPRQKKGKY